MISTAILLAAGEGSRLRSAAPFKPLCEVAGRSLLAHALDGFAEAGMKRVVVVLGYGADQMLDRSVNSSARTMDANNVLYALEASRDYDPRPNLEKTQATLLAINSADDLINPPELGVLEREIKRVPHGRAIVIPLSDKTRGHGSHTIAALWKDELANLLRETESKSGSPSAAQQ